MKVLLLHVFTDNINVVGVLIPEKKDNEFWDNQLNSGIDLVLPLNHDIISA